MRLLDGLLLSAMLLSGPAWGKHWHEDEDHWKRHEVHEDRDRDYDHRGHGCYFDAHDLRIISDFYAPRYRRLPPGLEKQYARNGHLPPGWQKRLEPMPVAVEAELAPVPVGYRRGLIDGFAVVYNPGSGLIVDVSAVFGPR